MYSPFSPAKKAAALVASAPQPVVVLRPPSAMGAPLPPVSQKGVAPDDDWNIEWKAEEVAPKTPAVVTPTSSETKTTTTVASSTKGAAAVAPPKLPEGILLARVSTRSIFVRGKCKRVRCLVLPPLSFLPSSFSTHAFISFRTEWKPAYWVIVNQRLWIYRSKADYSPDHYIKVRTHTRDEGPLPGSHASIRPPTHPPIHFHLCQDPFNERIKKCIPLRDSLRVTEMKSKKYPGENRTLHTFGVEDMDEDGGKSLLAKFAAYDMDQVRALREELDSRAFEARHGKLPR